MIKQLSHLEVITLFVEDLAAARRFYEDVFDLKVVYEDHVSAVMKLENLMINLLSSPQHIDWSSPPSPVVPQRVRGYS